MTHDQQVAMIALVPMARQAMFRRNYPECKTLLEDAALCINDPAYAADFVRQHGEPK